MHLHYTLSALTFKSSATQVLIPPSLLSTFEDWQDKAGKPQTLVSPQATWIPNMPTAIAAAPTTEAAQGPADAAAAPATAAAPAAAASKPTSGASTLAASRCIAGAVVSAAALLLVL
jgi:hypothetical protein